MARSPAVESLCPTILRGEMVTGSCAIVTSAQYGNRLGLDKDVILEIIFFTIQPPANILPSGTLPRPAFPPTGRRRLLPEAHPAWRGDPGRWSGRCAAGRLALRIPQLR